MLLMISENIARNMYSSQGIINYPTQLHLVGHFRILFHDFVDPRGAYSTVPVTTKQNLFMDYFLYLLECVIKYILVCIY